VSEGGSSIDGKRLGGYLRGLRERRKLSLDTVEEMSVGYPERITKSHLSRIENGQATPTFARMFTLSQIYGIPVASMAEQFEVDLISSMAPEGLEGRSDDELLHEARKLRVGGRYQEALQLYGSLLDRAAKSGLPLIDLRLNRINCLVLLGRYHSAKEDCELLLGTPELSTEQRVIALQYLVNCCFRMGRYTVAGMALELAKREGLNLPKDHRLHAYLAGLEGRLQHSLGLCAEAADCFRRSLALFEEQNEVFYACRNRLNLGTALADLGRHAEARLHLNKVLETARKEGFDRQRAYALGALGVLAYRDDDHELAESRCLQSNQIARPREYYALIFQNCFYLWRIALARGDKAAAASNERTLRAYLSRVEEQLPEAAEYRDHLTGGEA
jgi:tetratricopeptide (TPR) repeat protein